MELRKQAKDIENKIIEYRRHVHQNPELGFKEFETANYIKENLEKLGLNHKTYAKTGITSEIEGTLGSGKTILIRGDIDALPMQEDNDVPFKSKNNGVMHACGHDTHVACLLGVAELLNNNREKFKGKALLVFQPAEEGPGGATPMIDEGAIGDRNSPTIDAAIALHVDNTQVNTITVGDGMFSAAADEIQITIHGKGGHGSAPHEANDPVYLAGVIITSIQGFISRQVDPMYPHVFTIGKVEAGDRNNIISETAYMECTLRTMNREMREQLTKGIPEFIKKTVEAYGATAEVEVILGYDVGINDVGLNKFVREAFNTNFPEYSIKEAEHGQLGAEDFYEFGLGGKIPTTMFMLGGGNEELGYTAPNHSNFFNIDENCLYLGSTVLAQTAINYLNQE